MSQSDPDDREKPQIQYDESRREKRGAEIMEKREKVLQVRLQLKMADEGGGPHVTDYRSCLETLLLDVEPILKSSHAELWESEPVTRFSLPGDEDEPVVIRGLGDIVTRPETFTTRFVQENVIHSNPDVVTKEVFMPAGALDDLFRAVSQALHDLGLDVGFEDSTDRWEI